MRVASLLCVTVLLAAGCGGSRAAGEPAPNLDCPFPLIWNEVRYEAGIELPKTSELGPRLGRGVVRGCGSEKLGYYPDEAVEVRSVEGIDPAVAVAASTKDSFESFVWLAPGYLVETPRHPLHAAIAKAWGLEGHEGFVCGGGLMTEARALSTPAPGQPLEVEADDHEVELLLVAPGTQRLVSIEADTAISGLERHGVPYVKRGDEFVLVLRACDGNENEPGLAGIRLLIADRLSGD
jgi:hypothetical protein